MSGSALCALTEATVPITAGYEYIKRVLDRYVAVEELSVQGKDLVLADHSCSSGDGTDLHKGLDHGSPAVVDLITEFIHALRRRCTPGLLSGEEAGLLLGHCESITQGGCTGCLALSPTHDRLRVGGR